MTRQQWLEIFAAAFLDERISEDLPTLIEASEILAREFETAHRLKRPN